MANIGALKLILTGAATVLLSLLATLAIQNGSTLGSVTSGNEYNATTTVRVSGASNIANYAVLRGGRGVLGSVVITGVGTGSFTLYDATSTVTNTQWATTTLAIFPASAAAGTYTFDVLFQKGLLIEYSGALATSTITTR